MKKDKVKAFDYLNIESIDLEKTILAIQANPFVSIRKDQRHVAGFSPVLSADIDDSLTLNVQGRVFFRYTAQSKSYCQAAFKLKFDEMVEAYRIEHQVASELPEEITNAFEEQISKTMLEFAPVKTKSCLAYIDTIAQRLVFFSASNAMCDEIVAQLFRIRAEREHFVAKSREKHYTVKSDFARWVRSFEAPEPCGINERICIKYPNKGKTVIQKRHIANEEVASLIQDGEVVELGLSLVFRDEISFQPHAVEFSWTDKDTFGGLQFSELYSEVWEESLALDPELQAKKLLLLNVKVIDTIIRSTRQMIDQEGNQPQALAA